MANMKSIVCTKANQLVKAGYTKSEAFTKAWALVKAEAISTKMHTMSVASDRFNASQRELFNSLDRDRANLMNRANSIQTATEKAESAAKAQKAMSDWNRAQDIKFELSCMVRKGQMNSDHYNALRAELNTIAA